MAARVAFVTGGIGGIGSAICHELAHKGFQVVAGYHPAEEKAARIWLERRQQDGFNFLTVSGDIASFSDCFDMAQAIKEKHGTVDILINCAGITRDRTLRRMTEQEWLDVINVNLNSVFNVTRQFVDDMTEKGYGRIVNISSVNGTRGQFGQTNYSAAKAGMHGFTMALAREVAKSGVTVNSIAPGFVDTPMTQAMPEDIVQHIIGQIPLMRMAQPEEIAYVAGFLCDERAAYITGANIAVNGGFHISY